MASAILHAGSRDSGFSKTCVPDRRDADVLAGFLASNICCASSCSAATPSHRLFYVGSAERMDHQLRRLARSRTLLGPP